MRQGQFFFDIYRNISLRRIIVLSTLLLFVVGVLFYFNKISHVLAEREKVYVDLYTNAITFLVEHGGSDCDYTFVSDVIQANETVPVLLYMDGQPNKALNIPELEDTTHKWTDAEKLAFIEKKRAEMEAENEPVSYRMENIDGSIHEGYVYYSNSNVLKTLKFFPYIIFSTLFLFGGLAYISYSSSRRAEQNRVWVGLAKETAHQLGTPISGLMGWIEVLKSNPDFDAAIGDEMMKDVARLETITARFSNIGSVPVKTSEDIGELIENTAAYLKGRISTKINWSINNNLKDAYFVDVNKQLIEWVIENICKNAVDAMSGIGDLRIEINEHSNNRVKINISDTGKGMSLGTQRNIFNPGYSKKKRGWGLGLTLAKRIIETYHNGRLYVEKTELGIGTTFSIIL